MAAEAVRHHEFPCLDGLRAIAAFMVVIGHTAGRAGLFQEGLLVAPYATQLGLLGVSIFFVLSGFLLYRPYVASHLAGSPPPRTGAYCKRRFLRIFPAYWVALTAYLFVVPFSSAPLGGTAHVLQLYGLAGIYSSNQLQTGIPPAWSLCVELSFYALLPLFAIAVRAAAGRAMRDAGRLAGELAAIALVYALGVTCRLVLASNGPYRWPALSSLPALCDWFAIGMLVAVAHSWYQQGGRVPRPLALLARHPAVSLVLAAELVWAVAGLHLPGGLAPVSVFERMVRNALFGVIGFLLLTPAVFGDQQRSGFRRLLLSAPVRAAGVVSYGIFLWHLLALKIVFDGLDAASTQPGFLVLFAGTSALTVCFATASWFLVERPALRLKNRPVLAPVRHWLFPQPRPAAVPSAEL